MKKIFLLTSALFLTLSIAAQTAREEIYEKKQLSGANYYAYPSPDEMSAAERPKLTPAPKGYKPVYLSHYARHGSRWLINKKSYIRPAETLRKALKEGMLTEKGKEVCQICDSVERMARGRYGELSPLGGRQHRGIARRMYQNFPEIFSDGANVDARSTVVIRCILSMMNECLQLQTMNPKLNIKNDASYADMYYMNNEDQPALEKFRRSSAADSIRRDYWQKNIHADRLMKQLFTSNDYIKDSIDSDQLFYDLFSVAANMQSLDTNLDLFNLFTSEEAYHIWVVNNFNWYKNYGPSPYSQEKMPYLQNELLRNFILTADSCLKKEQPGATLRFGHEVVVLPLACLMELGDCGKVISDIEELADKWRCYKIFPMACNIQMVFYKNQKKPEDILVKVLLNEKEQTLPVKNARAPYYHWKDVREYYLNKINSFKP